MTNKEIKNTAKGLKELARLSNEERETVYNRFRENGNSEKAINELKSFVTLARWFNKQ